MAAWLLGLWVRIPPGAWMSVCCECCVLSGRGLCDELITRPENSYRLWCVVVCDLETSWIRRPWPALGRSATGKKYAVHSPAAFFFFFVFQKHDAPKFGKKKDFNHRRNLGWGRGKRMFSNIFINEKESFWLLSRRGANEKNRDKSGRKGMYVY